MIVLAAYDPAWQLQFEREASRVTSAFGDTLLGLHHIGSTAIPGLLAKPVIDMLAIVTNVTTLDTYRDDFESLGYEVMGEFGIAGRRYFRKDDTNGLRTNQIHAFAEGASAICRHLDFRDYLRAHPDVAEDYGELKQRLARECVDNQRCYSDGKTEFIQDIEQRAKIWKAELGRGCSSQCVSN